MENHGSEAYVGTSMNHCDKHSLLRGSRWHLPRVHLRGKSCWHSPSFISFGDPRFSRSAWVSTKFLRSCWRLFVFLSRESHFIAGCASRAFQRPPAASG